MMKRARTEWSILESIDEGTGWLEKEGSDRQTDRGFGQIETQRTGWRVRKGRQWSLITWLTDTSDRFSFNHEGTVTEKA